MSDLLKYISNLQSIYQGLDLIIEKSIDKHKGAILSMIKLRLFNKGIDGSGSLIKPEYSPNTVIFKRAKRQRTSHVTLRDSGKLYRSFIVEYTNNAIFINTNVSYKNELIDKYGEDIFNFTVQEIENIILVFIEPEIDLYLSQLKDINLDIGL